MDKLGLLPHLAKAEFLIVAVAKYTERLAPVDQTNCQPFRDEYRRDYERVLHSPSFRRLGSKTQLFPGEESDFFRTRLTHSLEVAQIAKGIANKFIGMDNKASFIEPDVCETAGLLHDIGHPPFGHNGERALNICMQEHGGFEGNAQTLHIVSRLEKKELKNSNNKIFVDDDDQRCGLNLTYRTLGSILKYDNKIPISSNHDDEVIKGYYSTDVEVVKSIKKALVDDENCKNFKTIECAIMDIADDIAYSTYDLEDAFKAGFLTPLSFIAAEDDIYRKVASKIDPSLEGKNLEKAGEDCRWKAIELFKFIFEEYSDNETLSEDINKWRLGIPEIIHSYSYAEDVARDGYLRTKFTSNLIGYFVNGVSLKINENQPLLSEVCVDSEVQKTINILKHFVYIKLTSSSLLRVPENRGFEIIKKIFEKLTGAGGSQYLPEDYQELYNEAPQDLKRRVVCDFVAGMTDKYATEFYGRLFSEAPQTIFKPF